MPRSDSIRGPYHNDNQNHWIAAQNHAAMTHGSLPRSDSIRGHGDRPLQHHAAMTTLLIDTPTTLAPHLPRLKDPRPPFPSGTQRNQSSSARPGNAPEHLS